MLVGFLAVVPRLFFDLRGDGDFPELELVSVTLDLRDDCRWYRSSVSSFVSTEQQKNDERSLSIAVAAQFDFVGEGGSEYKCKM